MRSRTPSKRTSTEYGRRAPEQQPQPALDVRFTSGSQIVLKICYKFLRDPLLAPVHGPLFYRPERDCLPVDGHELPLQALQLRQRDRARGERHGGLDVGRGGEGERDGAPAVEPAGRGLFCHDGRDVFVQEINVGFQGSPLPVYAEQSWSKGRDGRRRGLT